MAALRTVPTLSRRLISTLLLQGAAESVTAVPKCGYGQSAQSLSSVLDDAFAPACDTRAPAQSVLLWTRPTILWKKPHSRWL